MKEIKEIKTVLHELFKNVSKGNTDHKTAKSLIKICNLLLKAESLKAQKRRCNG